MVLTSVPYFT